MKTDVFMVKVDGNFLQVAPYKFINGVGMSAWMVNVHPYTTTRYPSSKDLFSELFEVIADDEKDAVKKAIEYTGLKGDIFYKVSSYECNGRKIYEPTWLKLED